MVVGKVLGVAVVSLYNTLMQTAGVEYDPKNETGSIAFGIGEGRSTTRVDLPLDSLDSIADAIEAFDPDVIVDIPERPVADIVKSTMEPIFSEKPDNAPEGWTPDVIGLTFRVSDRPHTRAVNLDTDQVPDFVKFLRDASTNGAKILQAAKDAQAEEDRRAAEREKAKAEAAKNAAANGTSVGETIRRGPGRPKGSTNKKPETAPAKS